MRLSVSSASGRHSRTTNLPAAFAVCGMAVMLVGMLAIPSTVSAQAVTGTLLGNVTDSSGAAVPGVTVTATETETNVSRTAVSNEAGRYIFSSLQERHLHGAPPSCRASGKSSARTSKSTSTRRCAWT